MKIKGPGHYSGPPAPPDDVKGGEAAGSSKFPPEQAAVKGTEAAKKSGGVEKPDAFESSLREIARTARKEGVSGEATVGKVVDSVLEQMLGKEFLAGPEGASLKAAMTPMLSDDEHFVSKLNNVLARLQKS